MPQRNTELAITAAKNIDINLNEGNGLLVQLTGNSTPDGTVDFQGTIDGVTFTNIPYITYRTLASTPTVAQLTGITTVTTYLILPPVTQFRIAFLANTTGNLDVVWKEVEYNTPFSDAVVSADNTNNATLRDLLGQKADAAAVGAVTSTDTLTAYLKQLIVASELTGSATAIGKRQVATTTEDLNQSAGTFDLFTGTTQDFMLTALSFKMPNVDVSDDCNITSISIQTDDVTTQTIISSTDGAIANLTAEAELSWTGRIKITTGTKIRLTIAGGTADATTTTLITGEGYAIVAGGNLA